VAGTSLVGGFETPHHGGFGMPFGGEINANTQYNPCNQDEPSESDNSP
jgi:hypothetical protein